MNLKKLSSVVLFFLVLLSLAIPLFLSDRVWQTDLNSVLNSPSLAFPFGQDSLGRDLFARTFLGLRTSLIVGFISAALAFAVGASLGSWAAMKGGWLDQAFMRALEILTSIPHFLWAGALVILIRPFFGEQILILIIIGIAFSAWTSFARQTRSLILRELSRPYVDGARMMGYSGFTLVWKHLRPNIAKDLFIYFGLMLPQFILSESLLSFIGIGIQAPETSLGLLIFESWKLLGSYPHLMFFPTMVFALLIFFSNLLFESFKANGVKN